MLVGIIGAMDLEVQALKGLMDNAVVETISTIDFYKGNINGVETVVAVAGVGKVNAAVCSQTMILKYLPDIMINVGVAGGLSEEFKIGDIAVADSVVEHDMDTSPIGDPVGLISGINLVNIQFTRFSTNGQIYGFSLTIPIKDLFIHFRRDERKERYS